MAATSILQVDPDVTTLIDYHHDSRRQAENGRQGQGDHRNGASGASLVLPVPNGTIVSTASGRCWPIWSVPAPRSSWPLVAGAGSAMRRWPPRPARLRASLCSGAGRGAPDRPPTQGGRRCRARQMPQRREVQPRRSRLASAPEDRGLPVHDACAQPRRGHGRGHHLHVADVPGLIEGASEGRRPRPRLPPPHRAVCGADCVIDCATREPGRDPLSDLDVMEAELAAYGGLDDRPQPVALNKIDVPVPGVAGMVTPGSRRGDTGCSRSRPPPMRGCGS